METSAECEDNWLMPLDHQTPAKIAQSYLRTSKPLKTLGWGIGGFVYLSPDGRTAVKVHHHREGFERELQVYLQLRQLRITRLHGLTIPKLRAFRPDLKVIQMDFVSPPFLLDFAGVRFRPVEEEFDEDRLEHWHSTIAGFFGPNAWVAYAVYNSLAEHDLYYVDFRPSNLNLEGLPGLEPFSSSDSDDNPP